MKQKILAPLQAYSVPLILGVICSQLFANINYVLYRWISETPSIGSLSLKFLSDDIVMVFFFGFAAKEVVESCLPGGDLNPPRKAINPLMGTLGGVAGPIAVFFLMATVQGADEIHQGWGIPTATDIALAWLVARAVFGKKHPAVSFLLLLAVADDAIGLAIIAIFYPDPAHPVEPVWLLLVVLGMGIALGMRRRKVKSFWPYLLLPGILSWAGLHSAHLHPALALVPIVPFMPSAKTDKGLFAPGEAAEGKDTLNRFEHFFKVYVDFGLFVFGFVNAGVELSSVGPATWAVLIGLVVGKTVGITGLSAAAHYLGFPLPKGMTIKTLALAGLIAGLGLTVALFVAGAAFTDPAIQGAAKMGALGSAIVAPLALLIGRALRIRRINQEAPVPATAAALRDASQGSASASFAGPRKPLRSGDGA